MRECLPDGHDIVVEEVRWAVDDGDQQRVQRNNMKRAGSSSAQKIKFTMTYFIFRCEIDVG